MENNVKEDVVIFLECPDTKILGVFGKEIHLLTHGYKETDTEKPDNDFDCVLIISEKVYLQEWKKWINGKRDYCERWNQYCGVMGYVSPSNPELIGTQNINKWNKERGDFDIIDVPVYKANTFNDEPDFEHG